MVDAEEGPETASGSIFSGKSRAIGEVGMGIFLEADRVPENADVDAIRDVAERVRRKLYYALPRRIVM